EGVKLKFDVYPEQIIDYLALIGDSSDNIPGIDKVGPKTGARLLQQYGGVDNLVAHVAEIPGKVGENLRLGLATLELSRRLAPIRTDLELPVSLEDLKPAAPDTPRLRELYTRFDLRALLRTLEGGEGQCAGGAGPGRGAQSGGDASLAAPAATDGAPGVTVEPPPPLERRYE